MKSILSVDKLTLVVVVLLYDPFGFFSLILSAI